MQFLNGMSSVQPFLARWGPWSIAFGALALIWVTKLYILHLDYPPDLGAVANVTAPIASLNPPTGKEQNFAAIVEGRPIDSFVPLILHFAALLGPEWPIHIFTPKAKIPESAAFQKALASNHIRMHDLSTNLDFTTRDAVSEFFTTPWFWEALAPAEHVLLFQSDSIICYNSPVNIENFLSYDFIGAPIDPNRGLGDEGMNGGLSIRNRTMILDIISRHSWKDDVAKAANPNDPKVRYEDQWYYQRFKELAARTDGGFKARLPTLEAASRFSTETMWFEKPFGFHQIPRFNGHHIKEIDAYCPEHKMATVDIIPTP